VVVTAVVSGWVVAADVTIVIKVPAVVVVVRLVVAVVDVVEV